MKQFAILAALLIASSGASQSGAQEKPLPDGRGAIVATAMSAR